MNKTHALEWNTEIRRLSDLLPYDKNPRTLSRPQYAKLKKSLKENGYHSRIVIDTHNVILAGHMRHKALTDLKYDEVEVLVPSRELTQQEMDEVNIRDNVEFGQWDLQILAERFEPTFLIDLGLTVKVPTLKTNPREPEGDEDGETEIPAEPLTKPGDLYELGDHRLLCGDCSDAAHMQALMEDESIPAAIALADPPYNVGFSYNSHDDSRPEQDYEAFCRAYVENMLVHAPVAVITPGKVNQSLYLGHEAFVDSMVWHKKFGKTRGTMYRAMVTEPILVLGKKPKGRFYPTDYFEAGTNFGKDVDRALTGTHTCPKPVALAEALIEPMANAFELVVEMFGGSGTTMVACHKLSRRCNMMEIDPQYCDVIITRMLRLFPDLAFNLKRNGESITWPTQEV